MSPFISGAVNFLFGTFDFGCHFSFPLPAFAFPRPGYSGIASFMCRPPSPCGVSPLSSFFISVYPPLETHSVIPTADAHAAAVVVQQPNNIWSQMTAQVISSVSTNYYAQHQPRGCVPDFQLYPSDSYVSVHAFAAPTTALLPAWDGQQLQMQSEFLHAFAPKLLPQLEVVALNVALTEPGLPTSMHHDLLRPTVPPTSSAAALCVPSPSTFSAPPPLSAHHHCCLYHPRSPCSGYTSAPPRPARHPRRHCSSCPALRDEVPSVDLPFVSLVVPCAVPISARVYVYVSFAQALK
ncbi:hypothetical protein C8R44DRAFT_893872 [Mycena epipterygia]|nr:hypothetical protein C8R44DRAFT_893872 [Mycena epipterygia]